MAKSYPFRRETEDELILIEAVIEGSDLDLILDSGASHTVVDFGVLIDQGFRIGDTKGLIPIDTANGILYVNRFILPKISALGISKQNFEVTSYLFDNIENNYQGILGLDFLEGTKFCIDLVENEITIDLKNNKMYKDVRCFLIERARLQNNEKISYSELSESCKLNLNMDEPHHRNLIGEILGNISAFEFNNNRPLLSSLVIGKDNNVGDGFYKLCE